MRSFLSSLFALCAVSGVALAGTPTHPKEDAPSPADPRAPPAAFSYRDYTEHSGWTGGCQKGMGQSPINIVHAAPVQKGDPELLPLHFSYKSSRVTLKNYGGHLPRVMFGPGSTVVDSVGGDTYALKYADIHTPAEHQLRGIEFPMEVSLVHFAADGRPLVVSVLVKEGHRSAVLGSFADNFPKGRNGVRKTDTEVNPEEFLPKERTYYRYVGSLTTPPCTGNAAVFVMDNLIEASRGQIADLRAAFGANARETQLAYGRRPREFRSSKDAQVPIKK